MKLPIDNILFGDCIKVLEKLPEKSVDLIFADPPYNLQLSKDLTRPDHSQVSAVKDKWDQFQSFEEYDNLSRLWISACCRVLKDTGTLWVIGTYHNIFRIGSILQDLGFWILNDIIWIKRNPMPNFRGVRFTNAHEILIWSQKNKGAKYTFNHHAMKNINGDLQMRSDWILPICTGKERLREDGVKIHSTQKPEALLYRILLSSTNPGDLVLDPFFGSGTTGAVAKKLGRHYIGIECNEGYIEIARKRIESVQPVPNEALQLYEPRHQTRIPFGALLETGLLRPGDILYYVRDESITAVILSDGRILCKETMGSIHSVAKSLVNSVPVNGWESWLCDYQGKRTLINSLRKLVQTEATRS